jgi:hypothetical protein
MGTAVWPSYAQIPKMSTDVLQSLNLPPLPLAIRAAAPVTASLFFRSPCTRAGELAPEGPRRDESLQIWAQPRRRSPGHDAMPARALANSWSRIEGTETIITAEKTLTDDGPTMLPQRHVPAVRFGVFYSTPWVNSKAR